MSYAPTSLPAHAPRAAASHAATRLFGRVEAFFAEPARPDALGFFRVGVALAAAARVVLIWPYLLQLYGNFGFTQWALVEAQTDVWVPSVGKLCLALQPYGVSSAACVYGVFTLYVLSLVCLALGLWTRAAAVCAWLLHCVTENSSGGSLYGADTMLHICLFYCAWMPVGDAFSLGRRLKGLTAAAEPSFMARLALRALQLHLCLIYLNTGLAKASGSQWRDGEAIWLAVMQPQFAVFDMSWLASFPVLALAACWFVLAVEIGYAVFVWPARTRAAWVAATVMLHAGIGVVMGLWLFSAVMVVMNVAAFGFRERPAVRQP